MISSFQRYLWSVGADSLTPATLWGQPVSLDIVSPEDTASEWEAMMRIEELEREVENLSRAELAAFRDWFRQYDSDEWDHQIERDVRAGKLDNMARQALTDYRAGKAREV